MLFVHHSHNPLSIRNGLEPCMSGCVRKIYVGCVASHTRNKLRASKNANQTKHGSNRR